MLYLKDNIPLENKFTGIVCDSSIFMAMTIKEDIDRYFELNTPEKLGVLRIVSEEVLRIINQKNYTLEDAILFLENNIRYQEEQEQYEVAEILLQIKQILEENDNGL